MGAEENGQAIASLTATIDGMRTNISEQFAHGQKHLERIAADVAQTKAEQKELATTVAVMKAKAEGVTIGVKLTVAAGGATALGLIMWIANQVWPGVTGSQ